MVIVLYDIPVHNNKTKNNYKWTKCSFEEYKFIDQNVK